MKKEAYHQLEMLTDKSIPYALVLLAFILILDFFYNDFYLQHQQVLEFLDKIIIGIFILDLIFKYRRVKHIPLFIKRYWLDILAVFPFYLTIRLFEEFAASQQVAHAGLEAEREFTKVLKSAEIEKELKVLRYEELGRGRLFVRFLKPIARIPRFFKAISFYEKSKHHSHR